MTKSTKQIKHNDLINFFLVNGLLELHLSNYPIQSMVYVYNIMHVCIYV